MKKLFLIGMMVLVMLQFTSCLDTTDKAIDESGMPKQSTAENVTIGENSDVVAEKEEFIADKFLEKLKGYWGTDNAPYASWDVFAYENDKVTLFTYPGEIWVSDGVIKSVNEEADGAVTLEISYVYYEMGSDESSNEIMGLTIKSDNDFNTSFIMLYGDGTQKEYVYMGETFEQAKAYADNH